MYLTICDTECMVLKVAKHHIRIINNLLKTVSLHAPEGKEICTIVSKL